jgi:hypothetical protein
LEFGQEEYQLCRCSWISGLLTFSPSGAPNISIDGSPKGILCST